MLKVLLVDDHQIVRDGLRTLLEREGFNVVAEAADGHEAVKFAETLRPDIAVLDLTMPSLNGIDAAKEILRLSRKTRVIVLTMHTEEQYVLPALRAGVTGYVLKSKATADLIQAIKEVSRGMKYLSPGVSNVAVQASLSKTDVPDLLSCRERQVLQLIAEGNTTKELADVLGVSVKTAESHRSRIMEKLDIHETATLVRYAIRQGLIQP